MHLIIFRIIFICAEELSRMKDYVNVGCEAEGKEQPLAFLHWLLFNIKHLLGKNLRNKSCQVNFISDIRIYYYKKYNFQKQK